VYLSRKPLGALPDLPPWWSGVLLLRVLWPVLARGLPSWVTGMAWVVLRVNYLALTDPFFFEFACFEAIQKL
jgi:hypothetical protein